MRASHYDQAYFDKWYRHPQHRVKTATELTRQVEFVVRMAEWVLGRPVRTVLDVGCGEGQWFPAIAKLRPAVSYDGVDPSAYAVKKFATRRHLQLGGIEDLDRLPLRAQYDLVVCCGMLNYLPSATFERGVAQVARRTDGLAYLEIFSSADAYEGDTEWPTPKSAAWYRRVLARAGLRSVGMHGYIPLGHVARLSALECGDPG